MAPPVDVQESCLSQVDSSSSFLMAEELGLEFFLQKQEDAQEEGEGRAGAVGSPCAGSYPQGDHI